MAKDTKKNKTLQMVLDHYEASWDYAQNHYHDTWTDAWKLYNNERIERAYEGISDTVVPIVFSTVESMVSSLAGARPAFDFQPTTPEQETDVRILNAMLDFYWDADQWQSKVDKWIRSMVMYGTGVLYLWWDIDRPRMEVVPLRDFFVDPTASDTKDAKYMGRRYLTEKDTLKSFEYVDPETGEMKRLYKNLDKIRTGHGTKEGDTTDKEEKDLYLGSTLGKKASDSQTEVIEYWTEDRVIAIANRSVVIRDDENPYKEARRLRGEESPEGVIPFVVQRNYQDESLIYGKGDIQPIAALVENLNDLTNQRRDAVTYQLNPMYTLDPAYADHLESVESLPGAVYPFPAGALNPVNMGNIPQDSFAEIATLKNDIREASAADLTFKGVDTDSKKTATEIQAQLGQAGQRLGLKVSQIENEGYHDLSQIVLAMVQIFVDEPQMVKVIGRDSGVNWEVFDPSLFKGEYEPRVQLSSTVEAKKQEDQAVGQEMYLAFRGDPLVNQDELVKLTMKKVYDLDEDEVQLLTQQDDIDVPGAQLPEGDLLDSLGAIDGGIGLGF